MPIFSDHEFHHLLEQLKRHLGSGRAAKAAGDRGFRTFLLSRHLVAGERREVSVGRFVRYDAINF